MSGSTVPDLLLAAAPDAPGVRPLLANFERAIAERRDARVLLAGEGLAWAHESALRTLSAQVDVAVCSRDASDAGWRLESAPAHIRWSSVGTWLVELAPSAVLWVALP